MIVHSLNQFQWHRNYNALITEMSVLSSSGEHKVFDRLFQDSADDGFVVCSSTGVEIVFAMHDIQRDGDGDVSAWILKPTLESVAQNRKVANTDLSTLQAIVFNT
jgi:hypothetical protein